MAGGLRAAGQALSAAGAHGWRTHTSPVLDDTTSQMSQALDDTTSQATLWGSSVGAHARLVACTRGELPGVLLGSQ